MNRIYALLLTVFMIVGVLTASAFAEAEIPEENTIPEEEEIKDPLVVTSNAIDLSTIVLPPQEEEKPEEEDASPDIEVEILLANTEPVEVGNTMVFEASVSGRDAEKELAYQWETSADGETWVKIEGAEGSTYSFVLDEENIDDFLRVAVTVFAQAENNEENYDPDAEDVPHFMTVISNELDISAVISTLQATEESDGETADLAVEVLFANTEPVEIGNMMVFEASVSGPDAEKELTYQWESSTDGETWTEIVGATESTYSFVMDEENINDFYRVVVDIKKQDEQPMSEDEADLETQVQEQINSDIGEESKMPVGE